jgi:predicted amino acid-binding ACT domain protein
VSDELGSLSTLTACFASAKVNISDISQRQRTDEEVELMLLTHKVKYKDILKAVELAENCGAVTKISNVIFMEDNG